MRPAGTTKRGIPYGFGFGLVSCPNYLFETLAWTTITVMTGGSLACMEQDLDMRSRYLTFLQRYCLWSSRPSRWLSGRSRSTTSTRGSSARHTPEGGKPCSPSSSSRRRVDRIASSLTPTNTCALLACLSPEDWPVPDCFQALLVCRPVLQLRLIRMGRRRRPDRSSCCPYMVREGRTHSSAKGFARRRPGVVLTFLIHRPFAGQFSTWVSRSPVSSEDACLGQASVRAGRQMIHCRDT